MMKPRALHNEAMRQAARIVVEDQSLLRFRGFRGEWQTRVRWGVGPAIALCALAAHLVGFRFPLGPVLGLAAVVLLYSLILLRLQRPPEKSDATRAYDKPLAAAEMVVDWLALLVLMAFTGGAGSPLLLLLIFHVIVAAILFPSSFAYRIAAVGGAGLWVLLIGPHAGLFPVAELHFREVPVHLLDRPVYLTCLVSLFTVKLFLVAALVIRIMRRLRRRVGDLARATTELGLAHDRLRSLYTMVCDIGAARDLEPLLGSVTSEIAGVMAVPGVSVRLLSEDGSRLEEVASLGLPQNPDAANLAADSEPVYAAVLAGETRVLPAGETRELPETRDSETSGHVLLTPLRIEQRVIGTLGLYAASARHLEDQQEFGELAAGLVSIAIENARDNAAIDRLVEDRTRFMLETAHNLRAPLGAGLSMLELVRADYLGPLNERQAEMLQRVDRRLRGLHQLVGEILTIAKTRDWSREITDVVIDLHALVEQARSTYAESARSAGIELQATVDPDVPDVDSGGDLLEQIVDNLLSNALKYTRKGGRVRLRVSRFGEDQVRLMIEDDGIGIPAAEQHRLFREYFRASNAKRLDAAGTGLGLALIKRAVERHRGRIRLASDVNEGTTVVIDLPIRQPTSTARDANGNPKTPPRGGRAESEPGAPAQAASGTRRRTPAPHNPPSG